MQNKVDIDASDQILGLIQQRGTAEKALAWYIPKAKSLLCNACVNSTTLPLLHLLNAALKHRQLLWTHEFTGKQHSKRQRTSKDGQLNVVTAAKIAQSIVKVYASTDVATARPEELEDLVDAMDLACVALYVVCVLEHLVRLGDLVVDNLLYQVAKKYAEMPKMRESASCIAACVHIRLWNEHRKLCNEYSNVYTEQSEFMHSFQDAVSTDVAIRATNKLKLLAEFPRPGPFHSANFSRLLLGHTNTCLTLLSGVQDYGAIRFVAERTLSPWIDHLKEFTGQNLKLASSFSDRTFRILWKSAAAIDSGGQSSFEAVSSALLLRSTALTFMLKCSNYTSIYFIQQVHRVGVQHECTSKRSQQGLQEICALYNRSADALLHTLPSSKQVYESESLQWEYVQWLEHFALICEALKMHLKSAMILETAMRYACSFESLGEPIQSCLLFCITGVLLGAADPNKQRQDSFDSRNAFGSSAFDKRLISGAGRMVRDLASSSTLDKWVDQCENAARVYLKKIEVLVVSRLEPMGLQTFSTFGKLVIRCLKRSSAKVFNYAVSSQVSAKYQLSHQIVTSFAEMCKVVQKLRSSAGLDMKVIETLILEELRLHRMVVVLSARHYSDTYCLIPAESALQAVSCHVNFVCTLLDDATMDGKLCESILQGILSDLKSIARECYSCATQCYKAGNYQDTISALTGVFELAEGYLDYVMCSDATADDIHKAHAALKVDAIASLLAYCFRETQDATRSRIFTGYSLVYCGDIHIKIPQTSVDKYVLCILDEFTIMQGGRECSVATFKAFMNNFAHVLKSRHIAEDRVVMLWRTFRYALECSTATIMGRMRAEYSVGSVQAPSVSSGSCVELCGALQSYLDGELMKMKLKAVDGVSFGDTLLDVSQSLAKRKFIYCSYYAKRDFSAAIQGLRLVYDSLTRAVDYFQSVVGAVSVDLGGVYGWRGIVRMEIALMTSYAGIAESDVACENVCICEECAVADIAQCLNYWKGEDISGFLFDKTYVACCLNCICNTLSLISCSPLKKSVRKLLMALQRSANIRDAIAPPAIRLFGSDCEDNGLIVNTETASRNSDINIEMQLFEQIDKELIAAEASCFGHVRDQTCQHLLRAITALGNIKPTRQCQAALMLTKAVGMRELVIHAVLSDFYFHEGRSESAIAEAKAALRVCWKMAKMCAVIPSSVDSGHFTLPSGIATAECQQRTSAQTMYFMALESSSWDVLFATKLMFCRIAFLYRIYNQPHRATACLTEAMRLVGGLNLRLFCRSPFYEYAEVELNANQLEKAKVAISLLSLDQKWDPHCSVGAMTSGHHDYIASDIAFIEQRCNEVVQRGDVHINEGNKQQALVCFMEAIKVLEAVKVDVPSFLKHCGRAKARCWRKYTQLQSQISDFSDTNAVEALLVTMKKLKQSMKSCDVCLERVKCLLELGRISLSLLRSASPRVFSNLYRTLALLEEAYLFGDRLGSPRLSQELRAALGMAYFAEIEENACCGFGCTNDSKRARYLPWMSSMLLANAGSAGMAVKEVSSVKTKNSHVSARTALIMQLESLAASSSANHENMAHTHLIEMAESITEQVQELPDDWAIVSVMIGLSSELVITSIPTNGLYPVSFCLPKAAWTKPVCEMNEIIQDSRDGLLGYTAEEAGLWDSEQKKIWWNTRQLLDERIEKALATMEKTLGFWRCLFIRGPASIKTERIRRCWELLVSSKPVPAKLMERSQTLLCAIANAQQCLSDTEVADAIHYMTAEIGVIASDSMIREALQVLRMQQEEHWRTSSSKATVSPLVNLSREKIARMTLEELLQLLAAEGLSTDGSKKVMVERLLTARETALANGLKSSVEGAVDDIDTQYSTILILHHELQQFPWEGMDIMGRCSGVTRMPSLDLILQNAKRPLSVRRDRVHFLLNPAGDLKSTQHQLGPILEGGATRHNWEGIVGEVPDADELRNHLVAADLFIYCGHGSGEVYLHRDRVLSLQPDCAAALLFGCSSGRLEHEGIFGPSGAVLAYLHAGSPAVVAMLWDVTDRDIDQLSVKILQEWLLPNDGIVNKSLAQVLQESRGVCKLKYLNGHAAICYGLPLYVAATS